MTVSAAAGKEAISHVCNCLAYFGVTHLNPEAFRQAKLGNSQVAEKFWTGLHQLIVLHLHNFSIRNVSVPEDLHTVQVIVTYFLAKWGSPVPLTDNPQYLLLALSFTLSYTDFFTQYDNKYAVFPTPFASIEEFSANSEEFLLKNLPQISETTQISVLSLYRKILIQIHETSKEMGNVGKMIYSLHEIDPSLQLEDLWVSAAPERIRVFDEATNYLETVNNTRLKDSKNRTVFWKWISNFLDNTPGLGVEPSSKQPSHDFHNISVEFLQKHLVSTVNEVCELWERTSTLHQEVLSTWESTERALPTQLTGQELQEYRAQLQSISTAISAKYLPLSILITAMAESSNIPSVLLTTKVRSEDNKSRLKALNKLSVELERQQQQLRSVLHSRIKLLPGIRAYNLS